MMNVASGRMLEDFYTILWRKKLENGVIGLITIVIRTVSTKRKERQMTKNTASTHAVFRSNVKTVMM